jgi:hypothetical protein
MSEIIVDSSEPQETGISLHHLPVEIKHTGMARVGSFFRPQPTDLKYQGTHLFSPFMFNLRALGLTVWYPKM